jgi:hypothetical protein
MKCLFYVMAFSVALAPLAGCETLTETPGQNGNRMVRAIDTNGKEMVDDLQWIGLVDRPSWLTMKPVPQY